MTARRPDPAAPLVGRHIRLDALTDADLPALYTAIGHPEVFAGGYGGGPAGYPATLERFLAAAPAAFAWGVGNVYAVRILGGERDGELVGTTTLADFDEANEHAHIGWTAYAPLVWGTAVNPEAKLLLLGAAFDAGFGRVKIQADERNARSRAAIAKLGAAFEGIVRRDKRRADGSWRDSAVFSIIVDDWPRVRAGLEERLAGFAGAPVGFPPDDVAGSR